MERVEIALEELGFNKGMGRYFSHPDTELLIEFPPGPLSIGYSPVSSTNKITIGNSTLNLLTPTQCVMDRLSAFYHWSDTQSLAQAILVTALHDVDMKCISDWSTIEGKIELFNRFREELDKSTKGRQ
ncbi:MAG: hypothetical protein KAR44_04855 [Candidatus Aegiribacteria sp.]|nr:hypothetical protein [Candidatus Aegiribacteria sp.]